MTLIKFIEILAILVGAFSGFIEARRKRMDLVGVFTVAFITAFGGGTLRDILLDRRPFFWVEHAGWLWALMLLGIGALGGMAASPAGAQSNSCEKHGCVDVVAINGLIDEKMARQRRAGGGQARDGQIAIGLQNHANRQGRVGPNRHPRIATPVVLAILDEIKPRRCGQIGKRRAVVVEPPGKPPLIQSPREQAEPCCPEHRGRVSASHRQT